MTKTDQEILVGLKQEMKHRLAQESHQQRQKMIRKRYNKIIRECEARIARNAAR